MSAPGALGLPPLLDRRRLEFGIPDGAFKVQAVYDRILVWQIAEHDEETFLPGGNLIRPESYRIEDKKSQPRGILISAGLKALDAIRSHGMDLGHIVATIAVHPWELSSGPGEKQGMIELNAGDLVGSEDLALALRSGAVRIERRKNAEGAWVHLYVDHEGEIWDPVMPWIPGDR